MFSDIGVGIMCVRVCFFSESETKKVYKLSTFLDHFVDTVHWILFAVEYGNRLKMNNVTQPLDGIDSMLLNVYESICLLYSHAIRM